MIITILYQICIISIFAVVAYAVALVVEGGE